MAEKIISFERIELTEAKLIEKFGKEKNAFLKGNFGERLLEGLTRFTDIWRDNQPTLKAHPAVMKAFHEAVSELANTYLQGGHLQDIDDVDARDRTRLRIIEFRDNVSNANDAVSSVEHGKAAGFAAGVKATRGEKTETETPETARAKGFVAGLKAGTRQQEILAAAAHAPKPGPQEILPPEPHEGPVVSMTFHVSGGNVFINADPKSWAAAAGQTQSPAEIADEGPKRRGRRRGNK